MRVFRCVLVFLLLVCAGLSGWAGATLDRDALFQYSTYSAIQAGVLDGQMTCRELKRHGDFGIGTFNGLDGEMIVLDGTIYQVRTDGKPHRAGSGLKTPLAMVTFFETDQARRIDKELDLAQLKRLVDDMLPSRNCFYAVKITGEFPYVRMRSLSRQSRPYSGVVDVAKMQVVFKGSNVKGTAVGYWIPAFATGFNVMSYHFHFISDDRKLGGHLLDCRISRGKVMLDAIPIFNLVLPDNEEFRRANLEAPPVSDAGMASTSGK